MEKVKKGSEKVAHRQTTTSSTWSLNSQLLEEMNAKLDELLATCGEIKTLKNEICGLRQVLKSLQGSLDFANQDIETLKAGFAKTSETVEENVEDIESLDEDIEALKRRNIKLEAYATRKRKNLQC